MAYTTINDPSKYFHTQLYAGHASGNAQNITNDANAGDFKPDWLWIKERTSTSNHMVMDSTRKGNYNRIMPNKADTEITSDPAVLPLTDGFSVASSDGGLNQASQTYVAWQWVANGGTTTTNDASSTGVGTIDSVYQANTTAGFSILTYTGTGSAGTIAHGLGSTPQVIITKDRGVVENWVMHHHTLGATFIMRMDDTTAKVDAASYNDTLPASTVFSVSDGGSNNQSGNTYVSYCFAEKQGYSKFGSYKGNNNADGAFVYTGFKPAWVMIKKTNNASQWVIHDTTRQEFNMQTRFLQANQNAVESTSSNADLDILSNGFKLRSSDDAQNGNGDTYIYMAFGETFVSSKGVPTTAR